MPGKFIQAPGAVETVQELGRPGLDPAAQAIAGTLSSFVPVNRGVMQASYKPAIEPQDKSIRVHVGSSFWHWMEYGTRFNPAYRPVENTVAALGLRYEAH